MLRRSSLVMGLLFTAILIAIPAIAAAATFAITGTTLGTAAAQPEEPGATCDPTAPSPTPTDLICEFDTAGTFTLTELGAGTYVGTTRLDWSSYTPEAPCAEVTGTMVLTATDGTVTLRIADTSTVCETANPLVHESELDLTVLDGTGAWAGATGSLSTQGTLTASAETAGVYAEQHDVSGTLSVPDPTAAPTVSPTTSPTTAPSLTTSASVSASPAANALPDTSAPGSGGLNLLAVILASLMLGSIAVRAAQGRARG